MEPRITSTYRLQFSSAFRFADAERITGYLADLGVTAMYASPYFRARAGSTHGYDVVDHNAINPEIGTPEEQQRMIEAAQARGLAHLLDFVPNHMGVVYTNPWWGDVLEWGEHSPYAKYFDIDWHPQRSDLQGKVLLPFLGDHYGRVLENGEIAPAFDDESGEFCFVYYDRRFPLRPSSYAPILVMAAQLCATPATQELSELARRFAAVYPALETQEEIGQLRERVAVLKQRLAQLVKSDGAAATAIEHALETWHVRQDDPGSVERLELLLSRQHYRLAFWRVALYEINYRRFFDINDLVGLRVEDAEVLAATHRMLFELIGRGLVQGVRIDHIDGLFNPAGYCRLLRDRAGLMSEPLYLVVEKILARFERLPAEWAVDGTTGYDFMAAVNGLFVNSRAELAFDRIYEPYAPTEETYEAIVYASKQHIIHNKLASELTVLADRLFEITRADRRSNDFTYDGLREALASVAASFPVYRTYVTGDGADLQDRQFIEMAVTLARKRSEVLDQSVFDFIAGVLTTDIARRPSRFDAAKVLEFAMKFQQFTAPVMAKSVEDTAFYRYVRLLSLNEVGGDPRRFGISVSAFHHQNQERAERHPGAMLATATHDHKRGEDTRLRISALSEMPGRWRKAMRTFTRLSAGGYVDSEQAPSLNDRYAVFQMIVGSWPAEWLYGEIGPDGLAEYAERIRTWLLKAVREAKIHSSWTNPNEPYEEALSTMIGRIFEPPAFTLLLRELLPLARDVATVAMHSSLSQVALKLTCPGVPDIYQGCELWDLSMVDPDNRRPVDFELRERLLTEVREGFERGGASFVRELLRQWPDGRVKLFLTWRLLQLRRERPQDLLSNNYRRLTVRGRRADRIVANLRGDTIVIVPRLVYPLVRVDAEGLPALRFTTEDIRLPKRFAGTLLNTVTNKRINLTAEGAEVRLPIADLLSDFPVAILTPE